MLQYTIRRLFHSLILIFFMSLIVFTVMNVATDPLSMLLEPDATEEDMRLIQEAYGLDKPITTQYYIFVTNFIQGDFGTSFVYNEPVLDLILERLPATVEIVLTAILMATLIGVPLGIYSGLHRKSKTAKGISFGTTIGYSLPNFWQAILLILLFSVWLNILPSAGRGDPVYIFGIGLTFFTGGVVYMIMPALNLAIGNISQQARLARAGTEEVMYQDYVTFARAKGISRNRLVKRHLLRNILIPIVTIIGLDIGSLIGFATVTETIYSWPGIGRLLLSSISMGDRPVVVAYLILIVLLFVTINFFIDLLYGLLDPRIRYQK